MVIVIAIITLIFTTDVKINCSKNTTLKCIKLIVKPDNINNHQKTFRSKKSCNAIPKSVPINSIFNMKSTSNFL